MLRYSNRGMGLTSSRKIAQPTKAPPLATALSAHPVPAKTQRQGRGTPIQKRKGLLLGNRELVHTDRGDVYSVGESELRIQPDLRILGLKKFLDEEFQHELGDFNAV